MVGHEVMQAEAEAARAKAARMVVNCILKRVGIELVGRGID
jgi:hypothetical protein